MTLAELTEQRLRRQAITGTALRRPADVVAWLGAVQAQEYSFAKWALGLRMAGTATAGGIEDAVGRGDILRTHVLRPTWHFVTPADIRWMLALTGPRVKRAMASYSRQQGIDADLIARAMPMIERALHGGRSRTRGDVGQELTRGGIALKGVGLALLIMHAELDGVVCSGPYQGRHLTYALLDERAPKTPVLSRDEALAELVRRYFQSHGPATLRDFNWWSGLPMADARRGLEIVGGRAVDVDGLTYWTVGAARPLRGAPAGARGAGSSRVHLLPIYDEYTVAYRDRHAVAQGGWPTLRSPSGQVVTFQHAVVIDGQVAGTWRSAPGRAAATVDVTPARRLSASERAGIAAATERYRRFMAV